MKQIADLKKGEYFTLFNGSPVWVRGEYVRSLHFIFSFRLVFICFTFDFLPSKIAFSIILGQKNKALKFYF